MRCLSLLSALVMPLAGLAAKKTPAERFNEFHGSSLAASPVRLRDSSYKSLTLPPRDYSAAIVLTALETRFGCQLCHDFQPEWELLARSWTQGDQNADSRLIFATLDFSDGREIFKSLDLQTAPILLLFLPTTGPHAAASPDPIRLDFSNSPLTAESAHTWLSKYLPDRPHPPVKRPINWMGWTITIATMLVGAAAAVAAWPYARPIVTSRRVWSALTMILILLFISGSMFNHIRKVPYVVGDGKGGISYIAAGFQNQYGLETQIVAAMYGALAFVTIALVERVPRIADPQMQQIAVIGYSIALLILYSFLLSLFRMKHGSYPFSLPPFM